MSRVTVLVGSPRRDGNTDLLARAFAEGAGASHEVSLISAASLDIHPCLGCNACYASEGHRCFQRDGMDQVYERLLRTDILVLASPVYFYGISAQLKTLIDRLHAPLRDQFPIRKLGLILVGAARLPELFDPILLQYRMLLEFFQLEDGGTVLVRGCRDKGDVRRTDGLRQARELGARIAQPTGGSHA